MKRFRLFRRLQLIAFVLLSQSFTFAEERSTGPGGWRYAIQAQGGEYKDRELAGYVNRVAKKISGASEKKIDIEFVVLNTSIPTMWLLPGGKGGISRGMLLKLDSEAELGAMIAHHLVHAVENVHQREETLGRAESTLVHQSGRDYLLGDAARTLRGLFRTHDRFDDLEADRQGQQILADAGYGPAAMLHIWQRFEKEIDKWRVNTYLESHEPTPERNQRNEENVNRIQFHWNRTEWDEGHERFRQAIASLVEADRAYKLYEASLEKEPQDALTDVDKALESYHSVALLHARRAELLAGFDQNEASRAVESALKLDKENYYYHRIAGEIALEKGDRKSAYEHLLKSSTLLPTAETSMALAEIESENGREAEAKVHYLKILSTHGYLIGKAVQEFTKIDVYDNPQIYFLAQSLVRDGEFRTVITNQSGYDVDGLTVKFSAAINDKPVEEVQSVGGLRSNQQVTLFPGWKLSKQDSIKEVYVRVTHIKRRS